MEDNSSKFIELWDGNFHHAGNIASVTVVSSNHFIGSVSKVKQMTRFHNFMGLLMIIPWGILLLAITLSIFQISTETCKRQCKTSPQRR